MGKNKKDLLGLRDGWNLEGVVWGIRDGVGWAGTEDMSWEIVKPNMKGESEIFIPLIFNQGFDKNRNKTEGDFCWIKWIILLMEWVDMKRFVSMSKCEIFHDTLPEVWIFFFKEYLSFLKSN